jgi:hypothetical protein
MGSISEASSRWNGFKKVGYQRGRRAIDRDPILGNHDEVTEKMGDYAFDWPILACGVSTNL